MSTRVRSFIRSTISTLQVNNLVGKGRTGADEAMQATLFTSSLNKKFMFFPGIIADHEYNGL